MQSLKFPNMFSGNGTAVWQESDYAAATKQNLRLLLESDRGSVLGDPYYGVDMPIFEQNSSLTEGIIADILYTQIALFMPQLRVKRSDIKLTRDKKLGVVHCTFTAINQIDFTMNTYNLTLIQKSDMQGA